MLRDKVSLGHDKINVKRIEVLPFVLAETCRKLIFGGCLVTPGRRHAIHVTSRRPVTSRRFDNLCNFFAISALINARHPKFFVWVTECSRFESGMSSRSETQLFHLNLKELEKNSVKCAFFHVNKLVFAYFCGVKNLKRG